MTAGSAPSLGVVLRRLAPRSTPVAASSNSATKQRLAQGRREGGLHVPDGTTIPYGYIHVLSAAAHLDPANYENPNLFDGFRFSRLREQPAEGAATFNRHAVSTATDFVPFGHGPHACPGQFFAAMQLKAMLAHILINYDIKAEKDSRPEDIALAEAVMPNPDGKIYIRRRV